MERGERRAYRADLHALLREEPNRRDRMDLLRYFRSTDEYRNAHPTPRLYLHPRREGTLLPGQPVALIPAAPVLVNSEEASFSEPLTKQQETIQWANEALDTWQDFARQPAAKGAREVRRRSKEREREIHKLTNGLLDDTEKVTTVMQIWQAHAGESDLYDAAKAQILSEMNQRWEEIPPENLAEHLRLYTKDKDLNSFSGDVVQAYFRSPKTIAQSVDAYYTYAQGLLLLGDDVATFKEASRIGRFQTDIIPLGSVFHRNMLLADMFTFEDPEVKKKARVATQVVHMHNMLSENETAETRNSARLAFKEIAVDPRHSGAIRSAIRRSQGAIGVEKLGGIMEDILELQESGMEVTDFYRLGHEQIIDEAEGEAYVNRIMRLFALNAEDPLWQTYHRTVEPKFLSYLHRKSIIEPGATEGLTYMSFSVPHKPYIMEMALPQSLVAQKGAVMRFMREQAHDVDAYFDEPDDEAPKFYTSRDTYRGQRVHAMYREKVVSEHSMHALQYVSEIGFPNVEVENLEEENNRLAKEISEKQMRFLNKRGFQVKMTDPALMDLGYERIEFRKDNVDPEKTAVTIVANGEEAQVKLDKYWDFDFEGKQWEGAFIKDSLRHVLLRYLKPVLCDPSIVDSGGEILDVHKLFITRVGHLAYLPVGQKFSQKQADALLINEVKDLAVLSEARKKDGEIRNTTYHKPVERDAEDIPPVNIPVVLPSDLFVKRETSEPQL